MRDPYIVQKQQATNQRPYTSLSDVPSVERESNVPAGSCARIDSPAPTDPPLGVTASPPTSA